jgi:maltose-binding protein MalE
MFGQLIAAYNQQHPTIHIIPQAMPVATLSSALRAAALEGGGPHIVLLHNHVIEDLALDGILLPLDTLVRPEEYQMFVSTVIKGAEVRDKAGETHLYGLPLTFDTLVLFYHQAHVVEAPSDIELLLTMPTPEISGASPWKFAYTLSLDKTIGYLPAFGGKVFDKQGTLVLGTAGRAGTERWLQWLEHLHKDETILAVHDGLAVDGALRSQRVWMTIDWTHMLPTYVGLWGDDLRAAPLPAVTDGQPAQPYVQSYLAAINARVVTDSLGQEAAMDFLRFLLEAESQQIVLEAGNQPARQDVALDGNTVARQVARVSRLQAEQGQPMPNNALVNGVVRDELERMVLMVLRGLKTPSEAVTDAHTALSNRLQEPNIPTK